MSGNYFLRSVAVRYFKAWRQERFLKNAMVVGQSLMGEGEAGAFYPHAKKEGFKRISGRWVKRPPRKASDPGSGITVL